MESPEESEPDYTLPPWGRIGRNITLGTVTLGSNIVMHWLNTLNIEGALSFREHVMNRDPGTALFTVCNHTR